MKGYTSHAIALAVAMVVESISLDKRHTMPLSIWLDDCQGVKDVCLSMPVVVGRGGITRRLAPVLSREETEQLKRAAEAVRASIAQFPVC